MIVEYIRYTIPEAQHHAFEAAYQQAQTALLASPHCLHYELAHCVEEADSYIIRIEWDSLDGHLQGFRTSAEFRTFFAAVRPFVNHIAEMRHYAVSQMRDASAAA
jgi:quinol monooxygenase YgiN